jgi:hypothetical protein
VECGGGANGFRFVVRNIGKTPLWSLDKLPPHIDMLEGTHAGLVRLASQHQGTSSIGHNLFPMSGTCRRSRSQLAARRLSLQEEVSRRLG